MLLASQSLLRYFEFELYVLLYGERSNETPGVPSNTSHAVGEESATSIPTCSTL